MKFKDLAIQDVFTREGQNAQFVKAPEVRVSCCKVRCNAKKRDSDEEVVFRPLDEVVKINEK